MNELVGDKIKQLRKSLKISQKALSFNICNQSEISRIENNKFKPSYDVLKSISERLGVDINYFLEDDDRGDYVKEVKNELYKARRDRDYETMAEIIKLELKNPIFQKGENKSYLNWNRGIVLYELYNKTEEAIELMLSSLSDKNFENLFKELDISILNSVGLVYWSRKNPEKAKFYLEKAYEITKKFKETSNLRVKLKIMYNLSKIYTDLQEYNNSLKLCKRGINICRENEDMFLYAELHYQAGRNYLHLKSSDKGIGYWEKAKYLFEFDGDRGKGNISKIIENEIKVYFETGEII